MSARHYRSRLEVRGYAASRTRQWRRIERSDVTEGIRDYLRNGVR